MKAQEARDIAIKNCSTQIEEISQKIMSESERGDTSLMDSSIKEGTLAWLKDNGYEIRVVTLDGTVKIMW